MMKRLLMAALATMAIGCGDDTTGDGDATPSATETQSVEQLGGVTYYSHIKPIFDAYCTSCHVAGGPAPSTLDDYESALPYVSLIETSVNARTMPPWGAEGGHQDYRYDQSLSDEQIELINTWIANDMPEGPKSAEGDALQLELPPDPRIDVQMDMPSSYTPSREYDDEYRCFVIEWPEEKDGYITAFNAIPGNSASVHHMVAFLVPPYEATIVDRFDDLHPGPGYSCYGGATPDDWEPAIEGFSLLYYMVGQWAPGIGAAVMPANSGQPIAPGSRIVLQMHYSTLAQGDLTDKSSIQFQFDEQVEKPGYYLPWFDLEWFMDPQKMLIPAGEADVSHSYQQEFVSAGLEYMTDGADFTQGATLHTLFPHMHKLGKKISLTKVNDSGEEVLVNLPAYDFDWQREYLLREPIELMPGDDIRIDCTWDNTQEARVAQGVSPSEPVDVTWGEGTVDEMCISMLYVTPL